MVDNAQPKTQPTTRAEAEKILARMATQVATAQAALASGNFVQGHEAMVAHGYDLVDVRAYFRDGKRASVEQTRASEKAARAQAKATTKAAKATASATPAAPKPTLQQKAQQLKAAQAAKAKAANAPAPSVQ